MQRLRLLRLNTGKGAEPKPTFARVRSPSGGSTLITSAPRSASTSEHDGPITVWPSSRTRMPASGSSRADVSFAMPITSPSRCRSRAQFREVAAHLHRTRQRMADDVLGKLRTLDDPVEIDAGLDAHLLAH